MGEADALAVHPEHPRALGPVEEAIGLRRPEEGLERPPGRPRHRGHHRQERPGGLGELGQPLLDDVLEPRRYREGLTGSERRSWAQRPRDLEREEGVAARDLVDPLHERPGQRNAKAVVDHPVDRAEAEGPDREPEHPRVPQAALERRGGPIGLRRPRGQDHADRLLAEPSEREREHALGLRVEPVGIVDRDEDGPATRERTDRVEEPAGHALGGRRPARLLPEERHGQRVSGWWTQILGDLVEHRIDEIAQGRERQGPFGLGRAARQDPVPAVGRSRAGRVEQGGLARPGLALQDDRSGERVAPLEEAREEREFLVPADGRSPPHHQDLRRPAPAVAPARSSRRGDSNP